MFCGTITAGGLDIYINDGRVIISHEGKNKRFVKEVAQKTFSGELVKKLSEGYVCY